MPESVKSSSDKSLRASSPEISLFKLSCFKLKAMCLDMRVPILMATFRFVPRHDWNAELHWFEGLLLLKPLVFPSQG